MASKARIQFMLEPVHVCTFIVYWIHTSPCKWWNISIFWTVCWKSLFTSLQNWLKRCKSETNASDLNRTFLKTDSRMFRMISSVLTEAAVWNSSPVDLQQPKTITGFHMLYNDPVRRLIWMRESVGGKNEPDLGLQQNILKWVGWIRQ